MQSQKKTSGISVPIELQSLVDTHEQPFVVIDRDYRIVAINRAYEKNFGVPRDRAVGMPCYKVSHGSDAPCHESGEDCPHVNLFEIGKTDSCLHVHYDGNNRMCQVRVSAFPLRGSDGELYMGELIQQLSGPEERRINGRRMVGQTPPFLACLDQLKMVAAAQAPVLLQGETGTGKELAAHFIHSHSERRDKPFLTVDCTVLTENLFETEVFGHVRGSFTGSVEDRIGLYEQADGGTLFLDEVGELPLAAAGESCCGCWNPASSGVSAGAEIAGPMCVSSVRPTGICGNALPTASSVKISITALPAWRYDCRRCVNGWMISVCWQLICWNWFRGRCRTITRSARRLSRS